MAEGVEEEATQLALRVAGAHFAGVAAKATALSGAVPDAEAGLLVAAAWLHDIGYASGLRNTGFHPLDGARYLRATGWDSAL